MEDTFKNKSKGQINIETERTCLISKTKGRNKSEIKRHLNTIIKGHVKGQLEIDM